MNQSEKTRKLVLSALLFAMALVLSVVESSLPPLPVGVPGVKFGLSNIAVMYALFFVDKKSAFCIAVLKALFVVFTRGAISGLISLSGGVLALGLMCSCLLLWGERISYLMQSVIGAVAHNLGQYIAVSLMYTSTAFWLYLPVLLIFGVLAGIATAVLLRALLPALKHLQ